MSVLLWASNRVSSSFTLLKHSSPSFDHNRCAHIRTLHTSSRSVGSAPPPGWISPVSFLAPHQFKNPPTRTHVRLLCPCFRMGCVESPPTNTSSVQVQDGPPHGHTLRSSTTTISKQWVAYRPCLCRCGILC